MDVLHALECVSLCIYLQPQLSRPSWPSTFSRFALPLPPSCLLSPRPPKHLPPPHTQPVPPPCSRLQPLRVLDEPPAYARPVPTAQPLTVHGDHLGGLADDLTVDHGLGGGEGGGRGLGIR